LLTDNPLLPTLPVILGSRPRLPEPLPFFPLLFVLQRVAGQPFRFHRCYVVFFFLFFFFLFSYLDLL